HRMASLGTNQHVFPYFHLYYTGFSLGQLYPKTGLDIRGQIPTDYLF
ncbi:MAG: hypothetical protein ACI8P3_003378, partial [Saprospiraceae bacterium]